LISAAPASGQAGVPGADTKSRERHLTEFLHEVNERTDEVMAEWIAAWGRDDAGALAEAYTEDAVVFLPEGQPVQGRPLIAKLFAQSLPPLGAIRVSQMDFDASGLMAFAVGPFSYGVRAEDGLSWQETGLHITVFVREGAEWRIRSQVFTRSLEVSSRRPGEEIHLTFPAGEHLPGTLYELALQMSPVKDAIAGWRTAWGRGEPDVLAEQYTEDALLVMPEGTPLRGRALIERYFVDQMPALGTVRVSQMDFHSSGRLAFMAGPLIYDIARRDRAFMDVMGMHLTVLARDDDRWRIRLQVFRAD
jgi:ketosteroid isomerase-like protein